MGMQDGARPPGPDDCQVQACFRGGPARPRHNGPSAIDFQEMILGQGPFIHAADGYGQPERLPTQNRAEITAGAGRPSSGIVIASQGSELIGDVKKGHLPKYMLRGSV